MCLDGACQAGRCPAGLSDCGGAFVDTSDDPWHCGNCLTTCPPGQVCASGNCQAGCPPQFTDCWGSCVDLQDDPHHCGACGNACAPGLVCSRGECRAACPAGESNCQGSCVDLVNDPENCGACQVRCIGGAVCRHGTCSDQCPPGETACFDSCVDLASDPRNCGACSNTCAPGTVCSGGTCTSGCPAGSSDCGGACVDTTSNPFHCGSCHHACGPDEICSAGQCQPRCPAGQTLCFDSCVDLQNDPDNCGGCGLSCGSALSCERGACVDSCAPGLSDCTGACVDTQSDHDNCGSCGNSCPPDMVCQRGSCQPDCSPGFTPCDGDCVDVQQDPANCGSCGQACGHDQACSGGECLADCRSGETNCGGSCVDTGSSPAHCGACGNACSGSQVCADGSCENGCPGDEVDCGGACVDLQNDPDHCGGCGQPCAAGTFCNQGSCQAGCAAGLQPCGRECVDIFNDAENCGGCGIVCPDNTACEMGSCGGGCDPNDLICYCPPEDYGGDGTCFACMQCPVETPPPHVLALRCQQSDCRIESCLYPWLDINLEMSDGCECEMTDLGIMQEQNERWRPRWARAGGQQGFGLVVQDHRDGYPRVYFDYVTQSGTNTNQRDRDHELLLSSGWWVPGTEPNITWDAQRNLFAVVWVSNGELMFNTVTTAGQVGQDVAVYDLFWSGSPSAPAIAAARDTGDQNRYLLVYADGNTIRAVALDEQGQALYYDPGDETDWQYYQAEIATGSNPHDLQLRGSDNSYLLVWEEGSADNHRIRAVHLDYDEQAWDNWIAAGSAHDISSSQNLFSDTRHPSLVPAPAGPAAFLLGFDARSSGGQRETYLARLDAGGALLEEPTQLSEATTSGRDASGGAVVEGAPATRVGVFWHERKPGDIEEQYLVVQAIDVTSNQPLVDWGPFRIVQEAWDLSWEIAPQQAAYLGGRYCTMYLDFATRQHEDYYAVRYHTVCPPP